MSYTTLKDHEASEPDVILATPQSIRQLDGIPASFRIGAMMVLRARRGAIQFHLIDGRRVLFDHGLPGPRAEVIVHDYDFAKRAVAGGDVGFAERYMDQQWSTPDLPSIQEFFSENWWKSNFLCNIGYADETALFQKLPRIAFDDVCEVI